MLIYTPADYERRIGYRPYTIKSGIRKAKHMCQLLDLDYRQVLDTYNANPKATYVYIELSPEQYEKWSEYARYKDYDMPEWCKQIIDTWPRANHHVLHHAYIDGYYNTAGKTHPPVEGLQRIRRISGSEWGHEIYTSGGWVPVAHP